MFFLKSSDFGLKPQPNPKKCKIVGRCGRSAGLLVFLRFVGDNSNKGKRIKKHALPPLAWNLVPQLCRPHGGFYSMS